MKRVKREVGETLLDKTLFRLKLGETFWVNCNWVKRDWANCYHTNISWVLVTLSVGSLRVNICMCSLAYFLIVPIINPYIFAI